ncbi:glucose-1-phosphate thymidylyltransferase [Candidatus Dojkabacteria bacterium]|nr:glucose-1-phosphate thymidylyltransferase [Candidatus Dojkabacteria bacterium]
MKALLLAGGRGTRMRPLTHTCNKHSIPIANKPLIQYPFEMLVKAGINDIAIIVNETREEIEKIFGNGSKWDVNVTYIFQDHPGGLAHALALSEEFMAGSKFIMVLGDNILERGLEKYVEKFDNSSLNGLILGVKVPIEKHERFGMATIKKKTNDLIRYVEKPGVVDKSDLYDPKNSYAVPGFYFFDKNIFQCFKGKDKIKPSARGELEIASPYNWLIEHGYKVKLEIVKGWYKDPGNPEDTLVTNQIIMDSFIEFDVKGEVDAESKLSGKVKIEKGATITNSILRGPLVIGKDCVIKDSYIGPYTAIYDNSKIINCEIENSIIWGNVYMHDVKTRIDSSLIGWDAEIREKEEMPRASKLFIGDNSLVEL